MAVAGANAGWSLSPDGTRVAIGLSTEPATTSGSSGCRRAPCHASRSTRPPIPAALDADGRSVSFTSIRGAPMGTATAPVYRRAADATGGVTALEHRSTPVFEAWTRDAER